MGRQSGQEIDGLAYMPVDRRDPDAEARCEAGVGVAAAQVGQDQQGLPGRRSDDATAIRSNDVTCEKTAEVLRGGAGQIDAGQTDKHAKAPGDC
ncbi:hypothetical protein SDIAM26S_00882 [Streptomyces diastaticus subsp. diastaticus]